MKSFYYGENMTVGERIYELRRERNISQQEIADALGVTRQTVSKWENGLMSVSEDKREDLAKILGVDNLFSNSEIAATQANKIRFTANQKIVIAVIGVFIALSCVVTVIVGIVSIPNLWADEKQVTSLYVDFGYFFLALGITLITTAIEIFAIFAYRKENRKDSSASLRMTR